MQRAKLKSLYFAIAAALAALAAYVAAGLPVDAVPALQSFGDIASTFAERVTVNHASEAPASAR